MIKVFKIIKVMIQKIFLRPMATSSVALDDLLTHKCLCYDLKCPPLCSEFLLQQQKVFGTLNILLEVGGDKNELNIE